MKSKSKIIILISTTLIISTLLLFPISIYGIDLPGGGDIAFDEIETHVGICNTNEHYVEFYLDDGIEHGYVLDTYVVTLPGWTASSQFFAIELYNKSGSTQVETVNLPNTTCGSPAVWGDYRGCWKIDEWVKVTEVISDSGDDIVWLRFWYTGTYNSCEPEPWIRTMPMTCYQVWINEDNNFQFIFWYPYKDKNFVKIYDMEDNMVFETDLPWHDPNLIVDLPDGYYWVETFYGLLPLQRFLIGKPGPEM